VETVIFEAFQAFSKQSQMNWILTCQRSLAKPRTPKRITSMFSPNPLLQRLVAKEIELAY